MTEQTIVGWNAPNKANKFFKAANCVVSVVEWQGQTLLEIYLVFSSRVNWETALKHRRVLKGVFGTKLQQVLNNWNMEKYRLDPLPLNSGEEGFEVTVMFTRRRYPWQDPLSKKKAIKIKTKVTNTVENLLKSLGLVDATSMDLVSSSKEEA